jgi:hypothetical protein
MIVDAPAWTLRAWPIRLGSRSGIGGFLWLSRRATSGLSSMGGFGRSRADAYRAAVFRAPNSPIRNLDTTPVDR